jgi:dTMP kinase
VSGRGFFLVLEGVEGAGKTTQARLLAAWLDERGIPCRMAREPGGTPVGEAIRDVLLHSHELDIPPETELLLMLSARAAFVRDVVRPTLERGEMMIADRFELSTFAYQGKARGLGIDRVRALNAFATGGLEPDLTVVLDLPVSEGRARQLASGKGSDRIESEGDAFLEAVGAAYRELAADAASTVVVDGSRSEAEVQHDLRELVAARFPEPFRGGRG